MECALAIAAVTVAIMFVVVVASDVDDMMVVVGAAVQCDGDSHKGKLVHTDDIRFKDLEVITLAVEWVLAVVTVTVVIMFVVVVASDVDDMMVVVGVAVQRDGDNHEDNRHYRHNQHRPR